MGHKPWDRPWKRIEKARAKRRWKAEAGDLLLFIVDGKVLHHAIVDEAVDEKLGGHVVVSPVDVE